MSAESVDVAVIGAGAGGGIVARELAQAGLRVMVFDRGRHFFAGDFGHDELADSQWPWNRFGGRFGPGFTERQTYRPDPGVPAREVSWRDGYFSMTGWCVGGGTLSYHGLSWRFHPETFRLKSLYGSIPDSTVEDWPISYDDLEPCYEKAEYDLGVCGELMPNGPKRRKPYPMPPLADDLEAQVLFPARRLNWKPFHPPLAINSMTYRGRPACARCGYCNGYGCEVNAKSSTAVTVIPEAIKTGLCTLRPEVFVREITVDGRGRPNGVIYCDKSGSWRELRAKVIVVAASAVETPRLLLNSKSKWFPDGIGNPWDQVGRHAHQDLAVGVFGFFEKVVGDGQGPGPGCALDFQFQIPNVAGGGVIYNSSSRSPLSVVNLMPRPAGMKSWGREFKDFYRTYFWKNIRLYCGAHGLPREGNRVDVDPEIRDAHGVPVARVTHREHAWSAPQLEWVASRAAELLKEAGAKFTLHTDIVPGGEGPLGEHQCGSCRMGTDERSSVTDRIGRVHQVPNVFIADGSLMTNSGGCNPCLTIQALAYWVGDHIVGNWKGGGLRG